MRSTIVFICLLFASAVSAREHGNSTSVKSQCKQVFKLTYITNLAANDTKLAQHFDNNQTAIDAFKSKATEAKTKLTSLSSNSTLMNECATVQAYSEQVQACGQIKRAEYMAALAANKTALEAKFDGNTTKIDAFKTKAADLKNKVTRLQSNTTLTAFCAVEHDRRLCSFVKGMQKEIDLSKNQTALETKFKGNTTKIDAFKAEITKAQADLSTLTANSTLMDSCKTSPQTQVGQQPGKQKGAAQPSDNEKSAAFKSQVLSSLLAAVLVIATSGAVTL